MKLEITQELVDSIHSALDAGLTRGLGKPIEGQMCIEALICHKLGLPHSDNPPCVGEEVRKAKIELNDCLWSSNHARAEGMRKLAIAQLGSIEIDQEAFKQQIRLNSVRMILPFLIQKHYEKTKDEKLLRWKAKFENLESLDDALWKKFYNNYNNYDYNNNYYDYYYYDYYYDYNNNYYNNYYDYDYYYYYDNNDSFLLVIAQTILQTLIDLKSPGCKWI